MVFSNNKACICGFGGRFVLKLFLTKNEDMRNVYTLDDTTVEKPMCET